MIYTWLGHGSLRLEIGGQVLLIDPWESGNPMFPMAQRAQMYDGASAIRITHGHGDHTADAVALSKEFNIPIYGIYDLMTWWAEAHDVQVMGFNKGGTVQIGDVAVTMVNATHSSSIAGPNGPIYARAEAGYMIAGEGRCVYVSGDTDIMADMGWMGAYYAPDIGIRAAGGHFTMDMKAAEWAAKKYFDFKVVIPCHYRTFPLLAQSADDLIAGLPGVKVVEPEVLSAIEI